MTVTAAAPSGARGLAAAPVGVVPIVWNNADLFDLAPEVPAATVLDEIARLGYAGCQFGRGFPEGSELQRELEARSLRLAERYVALPSTDDGLAPGADAIASDALDRLAAAGGEVLVVALDGHPAREPWSGRARKGAPRWPDDAFTGLGRLLGTLAREADALGCRVAFHPHTATWVEAPDEVARLVAALDGTPTGLCMDVGHFLVGGGDPVDAIDRYADRIGHVHLKDVDGNVLDRLRAAELDGFRSAVRERIFTELGNGLLDLDGVLGALGAAGYQGWLMVEQDTSWLPPSEAAAVGKRVLEFARQRLTGPERRP